MADTNDTIDGLLAEFRGYSAGMPPSYHVTMSWADFRRMLDRFEAAHKCERGDCAKLREAVKAVVDVGYPHNFQREAPHICGYCYDITRAIEKCFAALSAPPRNCDIAQDWLRDLYVNFKPPASVKREMPPEWVDSVMAFCRWLLAPAAEEEGGNDGNE